MGKRLKEIEKGTFNAGTFIKNMKKMVDDLVYEVRSETVKINISYNTTSKSSSKKITKKTLGITSYKCPKCNKGNILKGNTAYGCSNFKNGCTFRLPYRYLDKKISENQYVRLLNKGCTVNLKGFKKETYKVEGLLRFDENFQLKLEEKNTSTSLSNHNVPEKISCPKCKKGTILKGKTAYGCSNYKNGCEFIFPFDKIREKAGEKSLTKELVYKILNGEYKQ
ncbi:hypothetical protein [Lutibacter profundi]|uniref:hypothetical protein n=1 Tax=Lutibacter profundi TaxID=1622118 RepID=UPI000A7BB4AA